MPITMIMLISTAKNVSSDWETFPTIPVKGEDVELIGVAVEHRSKTVGRQWNIGGQGRSPSLTSVVLAPFGLLFAAL